jgi:uncharacterized protein
MANLPPEVRQAWENRVGPAILATVNPDGVPNVIYVTCVGKFGEERLLVADNYFDKTRQNVLSGSHGAMLFQSENGDAYQVKGSLEYHTEGELFDHMKTWNPPQHPGHAVAVLLIEEVYSGAKKLG